MRTGIFEYLRKCVAEITGKDPEKEGSSALYRFYSQSTQGQMGLPASGATPFKHSVITPVQTPPGVYYDTQGRVTKPFVYDATTGDFVRTMSYPFTGNNTQPGWLMVQPLYHIPDGTIGSALTTNAATSTPPDEWKWVVVDVTLAGGAATDQQLVAAPGASLKIQYSIIDVCVQNVTGDNIVPIVCSFQDSDNVACNGAATVAVPSFYKTQIGLGCNRVTFPFMGCVGYTGTTANRALEVDIAGGAGAEHVYITYAYREY